MVFLFQFFARWPLGLLHRIGSVAGWLVYLLSSEYRARFKSQARQAGVGARAQRQAIAAAGQMVLELPRLWLGPPVPVQWSGEEHIQSAVAAGRGIVFLTPHLGCFEVTAQAYAQRFSAQAGPMTVLYRPARQTWLRKVIAASRSQPGLNTAPANTRGVKQLLKALRAGHAVGLLPDQVPPLGQGIWAPFFGRPAYTMTLAARLALQTRAQVLVAWGERLPQGLGYRVCVRPFSPPITTDIAQATADINASMEHVIQALSSQYLWGYDRYKQPRDQHTSAGLEDIAP